MVQAAELVVFSYPTADTCMPVGVVQLISGPSRTTFLDRIFHSQLIRHYGEAYPETGYKTAVEAMESAVNGSYKTHFEMSLQDSANRQLSRRLVELFAWTAPPKTVSVWWQMAGPRLVFGSLCNKDFLDRILGKFQRLGAVTRMWLNECRHLDEGQEMSHIDPVQPARKPPEDPSPPVMSPLELELEELRRQNRELSLKLARTQQLSDEVAKLTSAKELCDTGDVLVINEDSQDSESSRAPKRRQSSASISSLEPLFIAEPWTTSPAICSKEMGSIPTVHLRQLHPYVMDHRTDQFAQGQLRYGHLPPSGLFPGQHRLNDNYLQERQEAQGTFHLRLPNGHWPLVLASRRRWDLVEEETVEVPCGEHMALAWPPVGWKDWTPAERRWRFQMFAEYYHRCWYGQEPIHHPRTIADRWHAFMLPGSTYTDPQVSAESSTLAQAAPYRAVACHA